MKTIIHFTLSTFLLLNIASVHGQQNLTIKGRIINNRTEVAVDTSVFVTITLDKTILYKTNCNNNGDYFIRISDSLNHKKIIVRALQDQSNLDRYLTTKPTDPCSFKCLDNKTFLNSEKRIITLNSDSAKEYVQNFALLPIIRDFISPTIYFKKNDIIMIQSDYYLTADSALCFFSHLLDCRRTMVIEVSGNCSPDEKNKSDLSLKRAQLVKKNLVTLGVNPQRIVVKGYADDNYNRYDSIVKQNRELNGDYRPAYINKTDYEWQTVTISQLSNDFGVPAETDKKKHRVTTEDDEEE
jgi:outer membrane protein OmpA-like peptidoglycan-associated protein